MHSSTDPNEFDIDAAGLPWKQAVASYTESVSTPNAYLRGPIPWNWLRQATSLGYSALATGLAVWHLRAPPQKHRLPG